MTEATTLISQSLTDTRFNYLGHISEVKFKVFTATVVEENVSKYAHVSGEGGGASIGYMIGKTMITAQRPIKIRSQEVEDRRLYVRFDENAREVVWKFSQDQFPARKGSKVAVVVGWFSETNMMHELAFINLDTGHHIVERPGVMFERLDKLPGVDKFDRIRNANTYKKHSRPKFEAIVQALTSGALPAQTYPAEFDLLTMDQAKAEKGKAAFGALMGVLIGGATGYGLRHLGYADHEVYSGALLGFVGCVAIPVVRHVLRNMRRKAFAKQSTGE